MLTKWMTVEEWLDFGFQAGFCSRAVCTMHDGLPMSEEEEAEYDDGFDPCLYGVRVYQPDDHEKEE